MMKYILSFQRHVKMMLTADRIIIANHLSTAMPHKSRFAVLTKVLSSLFLIPYKFSENICRLSPDPGSASTCKNNSMPLNRYYFDSYELK